MDLKLVSVLPSEVLRYITILASQMRVAELIKKLENEIDQEEIYSDVSEDKTDENTCIFFEKLNKLFMTRLFYFQTPQVIMVDKKSPQEIQELLPEEMLRFIRDDLSFSIICYISNKEILSFITQSTTCVLYSDLYFLKTTIHEYKNVYLLDKLLDYSIYLSKNIFSEEIVNQAINPETKVSFVKHTFEISVIPPEKEFLTFILKQYN
jgi:hypothetical protein